MNELELGELCQKKGFFREQIREWKDSVWELTTKNQQDTELNGRLKEEQKAKRELEKELRKKEKALAEVAALLVLSKKTNAILGSQSKINPH